MQEFTIEMRRTLLHIAVWGIVSVAGCWLSGRADLIPGLLFGTAASAIYFLLMCNRVRLSADMPAGKAIGYMRSGWLVRLTFLVAALIISLKLPGINFLAAVAGIFSLQIVIYLNAAATVAKGMICNQRTYRKG